jgi:uncharacterized protein (TIGR02145 family)
MYNLLKNNGVNITLPVYVEIFEAKLKAALYTSKYKDVKVINKGRLTEKDIKNGDFIYWLSSEGNHMGIVADLGKAGKIIFQSNGTGTPKDEANQTKNLGPGRGVHPISFVQATTGSGFWGADYKILRLTEDSIFTDPRDGQKYPYKTIGTQVWMTKNLNYAAPGSRCYDNNEANCATYGRLYDWNTARTVAPPGWHLPSDAEWTTLTNFLGGELEAGGKMKSTSSLWVSPNLGATNSSGWTGLPGGFHIYNGPFIGVGSDGCWWSSTEFDTYNAWYRPLYSGFGFASRYYDGKTLGFSVRCLRD